VKWKLACTLFTYNVELDIINYIQTYYTEEKKSALVMCGIGIGMILLSFIISKFIEGDLAFGIIFGLLPLAVFQSLFGIGTYLRSRMTLRRGISRPSKAVHLDPKKELARKESALKRFKVTRHILEGLFVISLIFIGLGLGKIVNKMSLGLAMAVLLQAAIMIVYDLFAQRRVEEYTRRLKRVIE